MRNALVLAIAIGVVLVVLGIATLMPLPSPTLREVTDSGPVRTTSTTKHHNDAGAGADVRKPLLPL